MINNLYRGYSAKKHVNWRQLSVAVLASLAMTTPVYAAEVTHSQEVELGNHKTVPKEGQGIGTIEVVPESQAVTQPAGTEASAGAAAAEEEQPKYREVRRNGVTYIEKVGKKKLEQEREKAQADEEQLEARMTQQKEIQEAQSKQLPGRSILQQSVLSDYDISSQEDQYAKIAKDSAPFIGKTVTKVTLEGAAHEDTGKLADVLKMPAGTKFTKEGLQDDIRALYETGWFYDIKPVFRQVPEGVQITYQLEENPVLTDLDIEGNTVISTGDIKKELDLPLGQGV